MSEQSVEFELAQLEQSIQQLVALCNRLKIENKSLLEQQANLVEERSRLIEKNEMARSRVEAMITRLKSMEVGQ